MTSAELVGALEGASRPRTTDLFVYLLAPCAARFGVTVHMATVMTTHFHLVVTVPHGNVSEFMHALDTHLACAIQVLRRYVVGVVWAPWQLPGSQSSLS